MNDDSKELKIIPVIGRYIVYGVASFFLGGAYLFISLGNQEPVDNALVLILAFFASIIITEFVTKPKVTNSEIYKLLDERLPKKVRPAQKSRKNNKGKKK